MDDISRAFARLGIDADSDQKAIRQAYARELKRIDQGADIPAFQSLREAYELVSGLRARQTPAAAVPIDDAQEAFEWMVAAVAVISGGRRIADESIWVDDLVEQLVAQQPDGIDAGWRLEAAIGRLLLQGWQPGHEALLLAATRHYGWDDDGSWPNVVVAEAWFERFLLHSQREILRGPLLRVIRDLRQTHEPDLGRLRRDHGYFEHLAMYYANLTPVIVDTRMLERWRELAVPLGSPPDVSWTEPSSEEVESLAAQMFRGVIVLALVALWIFR
jgi:hypothetical protein